MDELMTKAYIVGAGEKGGGVPASQQIEDDPFGSLYGNHILAPPLPITRLAQVIEKSNILGQCVEAMELNIDGHGYTLVPLVPPDKDGKLPPEAEEERKRLKRFFKFCHPELSFTEIRRRTRRDLEMLGNAYWEILRNGKGEIAGIVHVPAYTVRLTRLDPDPTDITYRVLDPETNEYEELPFRKRFRRYVQLVGARKVYWKELGDPRPIDARTGKVATDPENDGRFVLANEMLHFKLYASHTPYGLPRWAGNILSVLGSRAAEEVNFLYFDNKSVPPLVLLVSGGHLAEGARERIETYVQEHIKGREHFHSILVIEAEPAEASPVLQNQGKQVRIDLKPLSDLIQKDALFMRYDEANREKVRSAFRLPPLYVGLAKDFNRATAEEARDIAESQVFGPERETFDWIVNRRILPELGIRFWEFQSLSAKQENPDKESEIVGRLGKWLTGREVRRLIEQVLNIELTEEDKADDKEWLDLPIEVYLARVQAGLVGLSDAELEKRAQGALGTPEAAREFARMLIEVRKELAAHGY